MISWPADKNGEESKECKALKDKVLRGFSFAHPHPLHWPSDAPAGLHQPPTAARPMINLRKDI